jgi:SAM-dependent methyltransferase
MNDEDRELIVEQIEYYRRRAPEYDKTSTPSEDPLAPQGDMLREALHRFHPSGKVLELACGTGQWTSELVHFDCEITALDSSPEMIELNRRKVGTDAVRYIVADIFSWTPDDRYDVVVFGFWLSHIPMDRFEKFWSLVASCVTRRGRVWFADEGPQGDWRREEFIDDQRQLVRRRLSDGSEHRVVKVFWEPDQLERRLADLGWSFDVTSTGAFYWGEGTPTRAITRP